MPFRSKKSADAQTDMLTGEEPVVAGRFEWVSTATRDQLADMSARSKSLAGTARTRVTPLAEVPARRFRASREQVVVAEPEAGKSTPWLMIAIIAAIASAIVAIAVQRARQRAEEEFEVDLLMESSAHAPAPPPIHHHDTYEGISTNPS